MKEDKVELDSLESFLFKNKKLTRKQGREKEWQEVPIKNTEIGFLVVFPILGGLFLGLYLDRRLNTSPKLTLVFLFLGVIIGFVNIFKIVKESK